MLDDDQKREEYQKLMHQLEEQYAKIDTANPTDWNVPNPEQENKALVSFLKDQSDSFSLLLLPNLKPTLKNMWEHMILWLETTG